MIEVLKILAILGIAWAVLWACYQAIALPLRFLARAFTDDAPPPAPKEDARLLVPDGDGYRIIKVRGDL